MHRITLHSHVGSDGILSIQVPLDLKNVDLQVTITMQPVPDSPEAPSGAQWPADFFAQTSGSLHHDPLLREHEGALQEREPVE